MRSTSEGSVTAEVAIILPVVLWIVGIIIQTFSAVTIQATLTSLSSQAAHDLARGKTEASVLLAIRSVEPRATAQTTLAQSHVCVELSRAAAWPLSLLVPRISSRQCALNAN